MWNLIRELGAYGLVERSKEAEVGETVADCGEMIIPRNCRSYH